VSFIVAAVIKESPFKPVQLLWVNMIMDSLASLALATEIPVDALLHRPPYRKHEYIISKKMTKHIGGQAIFQAIVLFFFVFVGPEFIKEDQNMPAPFTNLKNGEYIMDGRPYTYGLDPLYSKYSKITPSRHMSIIFNMFVWMQIFNMLCARKINDEINFMEGIHTNMMFIGILAFIIGLQTFVMFSYEIDVGISRVFTVHLRGLTGEQWLYCVLFGLVTFPINFVLKFVPDNYCIVLGDEPMEDLDKAAKEYQELLDIANRYKSKFRQGSNSKVFQQYVENKPGDSFKGN
jgi:Ca2+ transporting ATPase